ncbi:MAG TPA: dTDP-4-dehydrorhamnose reductase [Terriglobales bacterium]|nr:dTDP-4-dehydrorhamnose reductase [Terriglobales bacterium]
MKVLLIGANGQLGSDLFRVFQAAGDTVVPVTHAQVDVCSEERVAEIMAETKPDVVVSTAAFHKVEECEKKPALAFQVNGTGAMNLALACQRSGAVLAHFSTDYVFDGKKNAAYEETDLPSPLSVYGASKVVGEHLIAAYADRYFVIRTCGLYGVAGSSGKGGNFVETMLKKAMAGDAIRVVDDQTLTPTYTGDLAEATRKVILTGNYGLYHVSSEGQCSWYEFTRYIFERAGLDAKLSPVNSSEFASPVKRPANSVLSKAKLRGLGVSIPSWKDALPRYLEERTRKSAPASPTPVNV